MSSSDPRDLPGYISPRPNPPLLSRKERRAQAKKQGLVFIPETPPPKDAVAYQIIQHRSRVMVRTQPDISMEGTDMMPTTEGTDGK